VESPRGGNYELFKQKVAEATSVLDRWLTTQRSPTASHKSCCFMLIEAASRDTKMDKMTYAEFAGSAIINAYKYHPALKLMAYINYLYDGHFPREEFADAIDLLCADEILDLPDRFPRICLGAFQFSRF